MTTTPSPLDRLLQSALTLHKSRRDGPAAALYRTVLCQDPAQPDALHLLGSLCLQAGYMPAAATWISRAVAAHRAAADFHANHCSALGGAGRLAEAEAAGRRALVLQPDHAGGFLNLGVALKAQGRLDSAQECCRRAVHLQPAYPEAGTNLGNLLADRAEADQAERWYRRSLVLAPAHESTLYNYANLMRERQSGDDARRLYHRALSQNPLWPDPHNNLCDLLLRQERHKGAILHGKRAAALAPSHADALATLGSAFWRSGELAQAVRHYRQAVRVWGPSSDAKCLLAHHHLVAASHYLPGVSEADLLADALDFARCCPSPSPWPVLDAKEGADRCLRVGYVSGDLRAHPVGFFLDRVFAAHDRSAVEIFAYSNCAQTDAVTEALRASAHHWRQIEELADDEAARLICKDRIDVLIDLSGHTALNRLPLFARRAAPVQVSWLGYFGTTGLAAMDYVLADRQVAPEDSDRFFTETIWRLPGSYLCFAPPTFNLPVGPPPALSSESVTFGNFNNINKASEESIRLWADLLRQVPRSRMLFKTRGLDKEAARDDLRRRFAARGIPADRLLLEGGCDREELLASYGRVDIALDPVPYGGGTTTAESLWMGVPVISLRGRTWVGRVSHSILHAIGHPEWAAPGPDDYVALATSLAGDLDRLAALRRGLRDEVERSPFCDGAQFTAGLEQALREMWKRYRQANGLA